MNSCGQNLTSLVHFSATHPHRLKCTANHPLSFPSPKPRTHTQPFTFPAPDLSVSLGHISKIHRWPVHLSLALLSLQSNHHDATSQWTRLFPLLSTHNLFSTQLLELGKSGHIPCTFQELHCLDCGWLGSTCQLLWLWPSFWNAFPFSTPLFPLHALRPLLDQGLCTCYGLSVIFLPSDLPSHWPHSMRGLPLTSRWSQYSAWTSWLHIWPGCPIGL